MEISIKEKRENALLGRTEIICEVGFEKTFPSRKQLREAVCAAIGVHPDLLVVVSLKGEFGQRKIVARLHAYKSKEALSVERKHLLARDGLAEKKKKAAAQKAAKK